MEDYIDHLQQLKQELIDSIEDESLNYVKLKTLYLVISVLDGLLFIDNTSAASVQTAIIEKLEDIKTTLQNL